MSKKVPRKEVMVGFYERMVEVFRVGGNGLFHAAAYGKLLGVVEKEQGDKLASVVLLSALSVKVSGGEEEEGKGRLMGLLGLERMPTRSGLIEDAVSCLSAAPGFGDGLTDIKKIVEPTHPQTSFERTPISLPNPRDRLPPSLNHFENLSYLTRLVSRPRNRSLRRAFEGSCVGQIIPTISSSLL